jgi:hypothetical protein
MGVVSLSFKKTGKSWIFGLGSISISLCRMREYFVQIGVFDGFPFC